MTKVVGLYSGETLADLRLLGVSADADLVQVVAEHLIRREVRRDSVADSRRIAHESARGEDER